MKLLATIYQIENIEKISAYADGFLVGHEDFGTRLTRSFSTAEISKAVKLSKQLDKEIFLLCNQMFTDQMMIDFKSWITHLSISDIDGIVVADLGAYKLLESLDLSSKVIYNPETLLANVYDFNFLAKYQIQGVYIAKEITLDDVLEIGKQKKHKMFMVGHGHLNMFYSKRQLIDTFMTYQDSDNPYHNLQDLKIVEENRKEDPYPILEDKAGTHVFRSQVLSSLKHLEELKTCVDYLVIDSLFKDDSYMLDVLKMYKEEKEDLQVIENLKEKYDEIWDEGFFYKKTIYQHKG